MESIKKLGHQWHRGLLWAMTALALSGTVAHAAERTALPLDAALQATLQNLHTRATKTGEVRVLVGLRTPFAPEGTLTPEVARQQRQEIASAQANLLAKLPAPSSAKKKNPLRLFEAIPFMAMMVSSTDLAALAQMPEVISIQHDKPNRPALAASVPHVGGTTAWSSGTTGAGQTVAVLDTGVDKNHPFLAGKVVSEACYSSTVTSEKAYSVCPGGVSQSVASGSGMPCSSDCDHGTHVAGIVAGHNGTASAPAGVAKGASLIAIQVFSESRDPDYCNGSASCPTAYDSDIIGALERVLALRSSYSIAAANMSLGGNRYYSALTCDSENLSVKAAIDNLRAVGIATVISSGNEGYSNSMSSPGCISSAISVGATYAKSGYSNNCDGHNLGTSSVNAVSCYSNSASFLSLLAPGSAIESSVPGNTYAGHWGTSMAAPHVAGAWAILKQKQTTATVTEVLNALVSTGYPVTDPRNSLIKPRIDVAQALNAIGSGDGSGDGSGGGSGDGGSTGTTTLLDRTGLSGALGSGQRFTVQVPSGVGSLVVSTSGGTGDVDLYVKAGVAPTTAYFDCESYEYGNAEICTTPAPATGIHHILLDGYAAYSGVALKVVYTPSTSVPNVTLTVQKTGSGQGTVASTAVSTPASIGFRSTKKRTVPQIVGGQPATEGAWPWQVRLKITTGSGTYLCGGSLLGDRWVVTAAHCVVDDDAITTLAPSAITVRAGSLQKDSGGQVLGVSRIVRHASYNQINQDHDVALLQLSSAVALSSTANAVLPLLASQETALAGNDTLGTVTGWGSTSSGGSSSSVLMQAQVPLITSSTCASQSAYTSSQITNNMICAGYAAGGKDSCQGDSGGPLVVSNGQGGHLLAGIVSWGEGCALPNYPGVYTRVANYQTWLESNTGLTFGTAPVTPSLIDCGSTCTASVSPQTAITLQATPTSGSTFVGWSGACTGTASTCTVSMGESKSVTASFNLSSSGGSGPLPNPTDFVAEQYRDLLGREADTAGLNGWVNQLNAGTATRGQVVQGLMNSTEFKNRNHPAVRLYTAYFLRLPDYVGLMHWIGKMYPASGTTAMTLAQVSESFTQSAEFTNRYGSLGNEGFVNLVYQNVLGRQPDAVGKAAWISRLNAGMSRGELMIGFSESEENLNRTATAVPITMGYVGLLRRTPTTTEHASWLTEITANRSTVLILIDTLLKSTEYAQRF